MLLKSHGTYPRIYCKVCEEVKEQDYFRGIEGILNGICEDCETKIRPNIVEIATVALVVIGMLIFSISLQIAEGAMK